MKFQEWKQRQHFVVTIGCKRERTLGRRAVSHWGPLLFALLAFAFLAARAQAAPLEERLPAPVGQAAAGSAAITETVAITATVAITETSQPTEPVRLAPSRALTIAIDREVTATTGISLAMPISATRTATGTVATDKVAANSVISDTETTASTDDIAADAHTDAAHTDADQMEARLNAIYATESDFYDEFRRDDGTWLGSEQQGITTTHVARARHLTVAPNRSTIDLHADLLTAAPANYLAEVDTEHFAGDDESQHGLIFRYQDAENYYYFGLWRNAYSLWILEEASWSRLIDWTENDLIDAGGKNRLGVLVQGDFITLLVNETVVDQLVDERFTSGGVGLYVESEGGTSVTVAFDNFDLWLVEATTATATADETESSAAATTAADEAERAALEAAITALRQTESTYYDGFRRDTGAWHTPSNDERTVAYTDRTLRFELDRSNLLTFSAYTPAEEFTANDYYVEVLGSHLDGDRDGNYGLLFRYVDNENFYFFDIANGGYGLRKFEGGEWTTLVPLTVDDRLDGAPGAVHRLGVWVAGSEIALLLDGAVVATYADATFPSGGVGLGAGTFDAEHYQVAFDDLEIWQLTADSISAVATDEPLTDEADASEADAREAVETEAVETEASETEANATEAASFVTYEDETFAFAHPAGWRPATEAGVVTVSSAELDVTILIVGLYSAEALDANAVDRLHEQWITLLEIEDVQWSDSVAWGNAGRRMSGSNAAEIFSVASSWINSPVGAAHYIYTFGVAKENAATALPLIEQVLASFTIKGSAEPALATAATVEMSAWQEPELGAFSLDVPVDWEVTGGIYPASDLDQRRWVVAIAPDDAIFATIGDNRVTPFIEPNAALTAQGYVEGDTISIADSEVTVWPYRPGEEFLLDYVTYIMELEDCDIETEPLPELTTAVATYVRHNAIDTLGIQQDAGALAYACGSGADQYVGYLLALTTLHDIEGTLLWEATVLVGYDTLPTDVENAAAALQQMVTSYRVDANWLREQFGYTRSEATAQMEIAADIYQLVADALPVAAAASPVDTDAMEVFLTIDHPTTGTEQQLLLDRFFGWIDRAGNLLGTTTDAHPTDVDFAEITVDQILRGSDHSE